MIISTKLELEQTAVALPAGIVPTLAEARLGLYPASDFVIPQKGGDGQAGLGVPGAARWYFENELIAVPRPGVPTAGCNPALSAYHDVQTWFAGPGSSLAERPQLLWLGAPFTVHEAMLNAEGTLIRAGAAAAASATPIPFRVTDRIRTNRSYYDASSAHFFAGRAVRLRGMMEAGADGASAFVARTIWPQDYVIDAAAPRQPLDPGETLKDVVEHCPLGASGRYALRVLWERAPGARRDWAGKPALGIILNGAQSDDDDALGGHFALATGHVGPQGEWTHWITSNFYSLEWFSEKGIIAAMMPTDNYLMDLNAGQSYYRPSYLLIALLKNERCALAYQGGVARVFHHFYRQDLRYSHSQANCAGISLSTLQALGWNIPKLGATSYVKGIGAFALMALKERNLALSKSLLHYFTAERTRLLPAMGFYAAGSDLLQLSAAPRQSLRPLTGYEQWLREDVEAILFAYVPQVPSSRPFGTYPVASLDEYRARTPRERSKWRTVPLERRPFPSDLAKERQPPAEADQ